MIAGIVFYRRQGDERVAGVASGAVTGTWPVEIWGPYGKPLFSGELESVRFGECLRLSWRGTLLPAGTPALFEGIGCALDSDMLCATFEQVKVEPDNREPVD